MAEKTGLQSWPRDVCGNGKGHRKVGKLFNFTATESKDPEAGILASVIQSVPSWAKPEPWSLAQLSSVGFHPASCTPLTPPPEVPRKFPPSAHPQQPERQSPAAGGLAGAETQVHCPERGPGALQRARPGPLLSPGCPRGGCSGHSGGPNKAGVLALGPSSSQAVLFLRAPDGPQSPRQSHSHVPAPGVASSPRSRPAPLRRGCSGPAEGAPAARHSSDSSAVTSGARRASGPEPGSAFRRPLPTLPPRARSRSLRPRQSARRPGGERRRLLVPSLRAALPPPPRPPALPAARAPGPAKFCSTSPPSAAGPREPRPRPARAPRPTLRGGGTAAPPRPRSPPRSRLRGDRGPAAAEDSAGHVSSCPAEPAGHGPVPPRLQKLGRERERPGTTSLRPSPERSAMPFGLKLRRTRRYNVLSKNCFVTRIRLLDSSVIECTLSVESTGQECLEAVAQRLELRETHYFGLWFLSKSQQARWVELEKPLKKHLDKFANEPLLFFGVMFYVPNVSWLQQEATRYQYYLQVKKDVLEGRLRCSLEQVIRLAGLAVQADFGDYNQFDSQDFLREYVLFPMDLALEEAVLEELTQKVAQEHKAHSGILPAEAELMYINEVEPLDGFGQEVFPVKDNHGNSMHLGVFFMGIFVRNRIGRQAVIYRWNDIGTVTHNKSTILVELVSKEETALFHMDDIENAKYVSRLFSTRHKFYKQNKICTEQPDSPRPIRRQPTWSRSSVPRQQPYILPPVHVQCSEHYSETHTSQDSIFHGNEEALYCNSHNSLDLSYLNGAVTNGSVCSVHSVNSLSCPQSLLQTSPVSSNLSIPGSDIMRADYIPSHRHSAIIVPSYRPTPDYETVMRQMKRGPVHGDSQSQSLRNLSLLSAHAYSQPEELVYSQPEMRDRHPYTARYAPPRGYGHALVCPADPVNPKSGVVPSRPGASAISHTVSTPELANVQLQGPQGYSAAHLLKNYLFRPPPPYPQPRPATSTPDLASHRHRHVSGSSPDLVTRKVQLSVKTFQEDSSPVVHQSLQEVSEPLPATKRHSLELMSSMVRGMEAMALKSLHGPVARRNTLRERGPPEEMAPLPQFRHQKTLSNATMLIHSSEDEDDEETPTAAPPHMPALQEKVEYSAQLQAALARIPNKPPPEYPGPRKSVSNGTLGQGQATPTPAVARARMLRQGPAKVLSVSRADQLAVNGSALGPSISEPDLTSVKERAKKEPVKERPVSEMFSLEDSIVEREMMLRNLEKQKMAGLEAQKRPLMLAALNGLSVARVTGREDCRHEASRIPMDERFRTLKKKLEEGMVFTEYEQIPKKKANGVFSTATLPENAERSRIREVVPYEENRVELMPTKENNTGYINASHIKVVVGGAEWHYIATQGPLPHTCHDFWQMVWEQGVNVIAMVTAEEEGGRNKSHRYWPKLGSKHSSATYGKFKVTTKFRTDSGCYATTGLKVKHLLSGQERTVWHLQYTDWPDHGCPEDVQGFLSYLEEIQSVRRHTNSMLEGTKNQAPPIVVHCSAGVGRTGVVILSELMIYCLEHNEKVEVPVMLQLLREQRMFMIQTIAQYKFVYQVLIQFLQNSRLI